jgi:hypothetical protein
MMYPRWGGQVSMLQVGVFKSDCAGEDVVNFLVTIL